MTSAPLVLAVEYTTAYRYARAVNFLPHRVAFHPQSEQDIRVRSASLEVSPHNRQRWINDIFSNSLTTVEPLLPGDRFFKRAFSVPMAGRTGHPTRLSRSPASGHEFTEAEVSEGRLEPAVTCASGHPVHLWCGRQLPGGAVNR